MLSAWSGRTRWRQLIILSMCLVQTEYTIAVCRISIIPTCYSMPLRMLVLAFCIESTSSRLDFVAIHIVSQIISTDKWIFKYFYKKQAYLNRQNHFLRDSRLHRESSGGYPIFSSFYLWKNYPNLYGLASLSEPPWIEIWGYLRYNE